MPSSILIYDLVHQQIEKLSLRKIQRLSFPEPLESLFEEDARTYRSARLWIEGLTAIGFFNLFLFANHFFFGSVSWRTVLIHTALITPIALLTNFTVRSNPKRIYREGSIALVSCWICFVNLFLERSSNAIGPAYAQVGVIVAVLFVNVVMRLRFRYALAASIAMIAGDVAFLYYDRPDTLPGTFFGVSLTICAVAMTVMANYSLAREERLGFLLQLRVKLQSAQLTTSNEELKRLSKQDALTELANRHAFDDQYMQLWKQALTTRAPLSAIIIDIDRFKAVNDQCGHLYGDQVLKRVATLLQQALRGKGDFVARFGGEEFVILLPGTNPEGAMLVAERVRKLVEVAGSPAVDEMPELPSVWTTVSCGVATCWPTHTDLQDNLIEAADKALYRAKSRGRNCVCYAEMAPEQLYASMS